MIRRSCGIGLLFCSVTFLAVVIYATLLIKMMPPPESPILNLVRSDHYYCLLVPVTVPVFVFAVYLNWFSINLYKSSWNLVECLYFQLTKSSGKSLGHILQGSEMNLSHVMVSTSWYQVTNQRYSSNFDVKHLYNRFRTESCWWIARFRFWLVISRKCLVVITIAQAICFNVRFAMIKFLLRYRFWECIMGFEDVVVQHKRVPAASWVKRVTFFGNRL